MSLLLLPVAFVRLLVRSLFLALGQVWANKGRSILTTIGIVIGVASVTAVVAALTGLKTNVLKDFESFGVNKVYLFSQRPDHGPHRHASWRMIRLGPDEFDGLHAYGCGVLSEFLERHPVAPLAYGVVDAALEFLRLGSANSRRCGHKTCGACEHRTAAHAGNASAIILILHISVLSQRSIPKSQPVSSQIRAAPTTASGASAPGPH